MDIYAPLATFVAPQTVIGWGVNQASGGAGTGLVATLPFTPLASVPGVAAIPQPQLPIP